MRGMSLLDAQGGPRPEAREALGYLRNMLRPFLEAYLAVALALQASGPKPGLDDLLEVAERLYMQGETDLPEARSGVILDNAVRTLGRFDKGRLAEVEADLRRLLDAG